MPTATHSVTRPEHVTAEWLEATLREKGLLTSTASISSVSWNPIGTGQSGDSCRFSIDYTQETPPGPVSLVAKFATLDSGARGLASAAGMYEREVRFYKELADTIRVRAPRPIHVQISNDGGEFIILMEDLSPATVVDQVLGCSPEHAALALEQAAALHADSWKRKALQDMPWLRTMAPSLIHVSSMLPDCHASFLEQFGPSLSTTAIQQTEQMINNRAKWVALTTDPCCLWHSDFRPDNLLYDAAAGKVPVAVVDWQTVSMGPGMSDVSYFLGTGLTTNERRAHEKQLVQHYHSHLVAGGVTDYSFDACWLDYRRHACQGLFTALYAATRSKRTERGDAMWQSWTERTAAQVADLDTFEALNH